MGNESLPFCATVSFDNVAWWISDDGCVYAELLNRVKDWFIDRELPIDFEIDDLSGIWFNFSTRGQSLAFVLEWD